MIHNTPRCPPGCGIQTFYDGSPPEAIAATSPISNEKVADGNTTAAQSSRKIIAALVVTIVFLAVAALGIGLGLGLTRRGNTNVAVATSVRTSAPTSAVSSRYALPVGFGSCLSSNLVPLRIIRTRNHLKAPDH